jgi:RPA family protein
MKKLNYLIAMAVTAFTFTSCEDVPEPFGQPINPNAGEAVVVEPTGSGTEADPYNVAKVTEVTKAMADGEVKNDVYTKGYICQIDEIETEKYGNATYWISDDAEGKSGKYEVYHGYGLGGQKFSEATATVIKVGDAVLIKGNIKNYKGTTPEYDGGSIIVELNGVKAGGGGDTPSGDAKTVSVADFLAAAVSTDVWYQLTGTIKNLKDGDIYGNFDIEDATGSVYVYGLLSEKGGEKKKFQELVAAKGIANGKKITIIGNRGEFNSTAQVANAYFVKIEDGEGGGGNDNAKGTKENPYNVTEALAAINALADNGYSDAEVYVKGTVVKVTTNQTNFEKYGNLNYLISEDGTETNTITVYSGDGLNGDKFSGIDALQQGDVVTVYGKLQKYVKNDNVTSEIAKGNYLVNLVKAGSGGNDNAKGTKENPYNVTEALAAINALADNGYSDAEVYVKGTVVKVTTNQTNFEKYGNLNYLISEDGTETNTITVYSGDALNGAKFTGIDALKQGDVVIVYGKLQKYVKNANVTPEIAKGNYLVSLNGQTN